MKKQNKVWLTICLIFICLTVVSSVSAYQMYATIDATIFFEIPKGESSSSFDHAKDNSFILIGGEKDAVVKISVSGDIQKYLDIATEVEIPARRSVPIEVVVSIPEDFNETLSPLTGELIATFESDADCVGCAKLNVAFLKKVQADVIDPIPTQEEPIFPTYVWVIIGGAIVGGIILLSVKGKGKSPY